MSNIVNIQIHDRQVGDELIKTCDGRQLRAELGVKKDYTSWVKAQIARARFVENRDYITYTQKGVGGKFDSSEYHFTLEAAKHIGMMSGTDRGHDVREYFMACERIAKGLKPSPQLPYTVGRSDTLTGEEQSELRSMLTDAAQALPLKQRAAFLKQGWSKLKAHFKVGYREIPRNEFTEALAIAGRHIAEYSAPALVAPSATDKALLQAIDSVQVMAASVADLSAAVLSLSGQRQQRNPQHAPSSPQPVLL
ncbi:MAG: antA/AntB antirepressor family protein [Delftia lacustris]|jgi:phage anti-repressor protein|uniref:antA/AntB antirepressor family protein n=1 Tax=Delftia TaxID=80865 RepID=UPI0012A8AB98|nr:MULTISPECIES: antA/AntB antirepressor family protein [Delftia]QFS67432.1 hypothetical protein GCS91_25555 [Delftia tsuruhatensis]WON89065.1 antA/AntB antirepressor family protein [Delftia sp. UGAL515B_04]